jgi:hypothetical protein
MTFCGLTWDFLRNNTCYPETSNIHQDKTNFLAEQSNNDIIYFSSRYPLMVSLHKIQSGFIICIKGFVNHSVVLCNANASDLLHCVLITQTSLCAVQVEPATFLEMPQISHQFHLLLLHQHVSTAFFLMFNTECFAQNPVIQL